METIMNEFGKCDLLCANCHLELHNPDYTKKNIMLIL
jgi:hypothetical protein